MSKVTNDGLTWSGTGCCTYMATVGVTGLTDAVTFVDYNVSNGSINTGEMSREGDLFVG